MRMCCFCLLIFSLAIVSGCMRMSGYKEASHCAIMRMRPGQHLPPLQSGAPLFQDFNA